MAIVDEELVANTIPKFEVQEKYLDMDGNQAWTFEDIKSSDVKAMAYNVNWLQNKMDIFKVPVMFVGGSYNLVPSAYSNIPPFSFIPYQFNNTTKMFTKAFNFSSNVSNNGSGLVQFDANNSLDSTIDTKGFITRRLDANMTTLKRAEVFRKKYPADEIYVKDLAQFSVGEKTQPVASGSLANPTFQQRSNRYIDLSTCETNATLAYDSSPTPTNNFGAIVENLIHYKDNAAKILWYDCVQSFNRDTLKGHYAEGVNIRNYFTYGTWTRNQPRPKVYGTQVEQGTWKYANVSVFASVEPGQVGTVRVTTGISSFSTNFTNSDPEWKTFQIQLETEDLSNPLLINPSQLTGAGNINIELWKNTSAAGLFQIFGVVIWEQVRFV